MVLYTVNSYLWRHQSPLLWLSIAPHTRESLLLLPVAARTHRNTKTSNKDLIGVYKICIPEQISLGPEQSKHHTRYCAKVSQLPGGRCYSSNTFSPVLPCRQNGNISQDIYCTQNDVSSAMHSAISAMSDGNLINLCPLSETVTFQGMLKKVF